MNKNTITITNNRDGKTYEFNILDASVGPSVVNISTFYKETGMFTYDEGYTSTASCQSKITYIDDEAVKLLSSFTTLYHFKSYIFKHIW